MPEHRPPITPARKTSPLRRRELAALIAVLMVVLAAVPTAALEPSEVAVLYNSKSPNSLAIATFYAQARQIPEDHIIPIFCPFSDEISEEEYRTRIVPQVRQGLAERKLEGGVKCLVTAYDMPLKIGAYQPTFPQRQEINGYKERLSDALLEMDRDVAVYDGIATPPAAAAATQGTGTQGAAASVASQPATQFGPKDHKLTWVEEVQKLSAAAGAAAGRLAKLPEAQRRTALATLFKIHEHVAGIAGVLAGFHVRDDSPDADAGREQIGRLQDQLQEIEKQAGELAKDQNNPASRKQIIALRLLSHGLVGESREIETVLALLEPAETESCFDNELALVLADQDYPRGRWVNNPRNLGVFPSTSRWPKIPRTLLVARVDGPSAAKTREMIETGLKIEKTGLDGKIYLDARGLHEGPYAVFDAQLRELAAWLKINSTMEVVLDDRPELFEAKDCPRAALYCGWYSLRNYKDSCQWLPGAVGYHVASLEMLSLHNPEETGWVPNLLKRGFCGTLGATAEPYLSSFPNPAYFFPLLMSGEFTQGEVWEVTAPFLSWRTGFVGDPLYNPFKAHPRVTVQALKEHVVLRNAFAMLRPEPKAGAASAPATTQSGAK